MNKLFLLLGLAVFQGCAQKPYFGDLDYLGKLPSKLNEVSGIVSTDREFAWAIEDNGNKDRLYQIDLKGNLISELKVKNAKNNDWEDLAKDLDGNLYIGDFGNNANGRKNLVIFKLPNPKEVKGGKIGAERIEFHYPEQTRFPPKKSKLLFDCEAFFHHGGALYLITKNRTRPYTGKALVYKVPDRPGSYAAQLVGTLETCHESQFCSITGADISEDGKKIVLLASGYIWLYADFFFDDFSKGNVQVIDVKHRTQQESICFLDGNTLLIADEQSKTKGGNLYSYILKVD